MKSKKWLLFLGVMAAAVSPVLGQYFGSPANSTDWNYVYDARFDGRPDQDSPTWSRGVYTTTDPSAVNYSGVTNDIWTGEKTLFMRQPNATGPSYYYSSLGTAVQTGTTNDQFTMDFRFRVADAAQADSMDQLFMQVDRPRADGAFGRQLYNLSFRENGVKYMDGGITKYFTAVALGTNWHTARWQLDVKNGQASFYLDDSTTAKFTCARTTLADATVNRIIWGDVVACTGEALVSYIRIATNALVAPRATNVVVAHTGMLNPSTSGFTQAKYGTTTAQGGTESGVEYWEVNDNDTTQVIFYRKSLGESEVYHQSGWTATVKARVIETMGRPTVMHVCDGHDEWALLLDASGVYSSTATTLAAMDTTDAYHIYQIIYNPFADSGMGQAAYYVDGQLIGNLTRSDVINDTSIRRFDFGGFSNPLTCKIRWAEAKFEIGSNVYVPPPPTGTVIILR